jgi:hypothetical protein
MMTAFAVTRTLSARSVQPSSKAVRDVSSPDGRDASRVCRNGCGQGCYARGLCWSCYRSANAAGMLPPALISNPREATDRRADFAELRSWGLSVADAAARLGVCKRTAERYEAARNRSTPATPARPAPTRAPSRSAVCGGSLMQPTDFHYVITLNWQPSDYTTASSTRAGVITVSSDDLSAVEATRAQLFSHILTQTRRELGIPDDNGTVVVVFFTVEPNALPTPAAAVQQTGRAA